MAKRMTLDETWKNCLKMWKSIAKQVKAMGDFDQWDTVDELKRKWLEDEGFEDIEEDCFFCDYSDEECLFRDLSDSCPARLVDPDFNCTNDNYSFRAKPAKFYNKLRSLNRKRLKAKP